MKSHEYLEFAGALVYWALGGCKGDVTSFLSKKGQPEEQIKNVLTGLLFVILTGSFLAIIFNA